MKSAELMPAAIEEILLWTSPNEHLAFGHGEHGCAGAHLALFELRLMLKANWTID